MRLARPAERTHMLANAAEKIDGPNDASDALRLAGCMGRLEVLHAVLEITAPGQPRFAEINFENESVDSYCDAAIDAVRRRLGSSISRLSFLQREDLRERVIEQSGLTFPSRRLGEHLDPAYRKAWETAYRQIIKALEPRFLIS